MRTEASPGAPGRRSDQRHPAAEHGPGRTAPAHTIVIDGEHAGRRLDKFLRSRFKEVPAGLLFRLLRQGKLRVNGRKAQQNQRLQEGDEITVPELRVAPEPAPSPDLAPALVEQLRASVLHEDADLLILDKPAGVAVHRGTDVPAGVIEVMRRLRPELPELELSHRLDRDTSGVLALAKSPSMLRHLHDLLRDREDLIERRYLALVAGHWPEGTNVLRAPLRREETRVVVDPDGRRAETHVEVAQRFGDRATLLDVRLLTGRKHQIRVHLQHAGHPIAGDDRYGDDAFNRRVADLGGTGLHLHAAELALPRPDGTILEVTAPMPRRWEQLLRSGL